MKRNRRHRQRRIVNQESTRGGEGIWNCVSINDNIDDDDNSDDDDTDDSDYDDSDDDNVNNEVVSPSSSLHRFLSSINKSRPRLPTMHIHIQPWRIILCGFVLLPSVWVYLYGTYTGIPRSKRMIQLSSSTSSSTTNHDHEHEHDDDESTATSTSVLDWIVIVLYASANPSGTAGMVAMGIYVFGTVGKHCPLWSSYIVMPKTNSKTNTNTNHLLKDALRLHQWSGYISFLWILLHTVLYLLIYGVMGMVRSQSQTPEQEEVHDADYHEEDQQQQSWSSSLVWIFLQSASQAVIPPAQCRPWYHNTTTTTTATTNSTSDTDTDTNNATTDTADGTMASTSVMDHHHHYHDLRVLLQYFHENGTVVVANATAGEEEHQHEQHQEQEQHHHGSSCYGYYRNFYGFLGTLSFLFLVLTSITWVRRYNYRVFYGSHVICASLFIIGTILHMKRNIVYILPSIICYLSTTIPTVLQHAWFIPSLSSFVSVGYKNRNDDSNSNSNGVGNGGVKIEEYKLLSLTSKSNNNISSNSDDNDNDNCDITNTDDTTSNGTDDNDGCDCVELTFSVDNNLLPRSRGLIDEDNEDEDNDERNNSRNSSGLLSSSSYRPKSVKICVPSISFLWYPFTIIETTTTTTTTSGGNGGNDDDDDGRHPRPTTKSVLQIKILMQRAGYFTTTLLNQFKCLNEEERNKEHEKVQRHHRRISNIENGNGKGTDNGADFDVDFGGHSSSSSNGSDSSSKSYNNTDDDNHDHEEKDKIQQLAVMPLILVDGFYSGTSDWIGSAFNHDVVLIAAGGIGVTPFLTFLPILLKEMIRSSYNPHERSSRLKTVSFLWCCRNEALIQHVIQSYLLPLFHQQQQQYQQQQQHNGLLLDGEEGTTGSRCLAPNDGTTVHDPLSSDDTPNNDDDDDHTVISIPPIRFQLLIYNTSRNRDDHDDISLCPDISSSSNSSCSIKRDIFRDEIISEEDQNPCNVENYRRRTGICGGSGSGDGSSSNGNPMRPSKAYHNPSSSSTTVVIACISFLSISIVGMVLHRYLYLHYILENTHSFSVRPYGLIAILIVSIVFGVIVDKLWRCCWFVSSSSSSSSSSLTTRRCKNGYTRTVTELNTSELSLSDEDDDISNITSRNDDNHNNNDNSNDTIFCENDGTQNRTEFVDVRSLSPGKPIRQLIGTTRSVKKVLLELEISNGRPVLFDDNSTIINNDGDEDENEDDDEDSNNTGPSTNATAYTTIATTTTQPTVATTMRNVAIAQNPGVFYCGTTGLLDRIKFGVNNIQQQRRRRRQRTDDDNDDDDAADTKNKGPVNDCVYYEESFEM